MMPILRTLLGNAWKYTARTAQPAVRLYAEQFDGGDLDLRERQRRGFRHEPVGAVALVPSHACAARMNSRGMAWASPPCQGIIERHGGRIEARGAVGEGGDRALLAAHTGIKCDRAHAAPAAALPRNAPRRCSLRQFCFVRHWRTFRVRGERGAGHKVLGLAIGGMARIKGRSLGAVTALAASCPGFWRSRRMRLCTTAPYLVDADKISPATPPGCWPPRHWCCS